MMQIGYTIHGGLLRNTICFARGSKDELLWSCIKIFHRVLKQCEGILEAFSTKVSMEIEFMASAETASRN